MSRTTSFFAGCQLLALAGCVPALTPAGRDVHVRTTRPFGCTEIGTLHGTGDGGDHPASGDATDSSHSDLRNKGAEMGANYVWIDGSDLMGSTIYARAFRCDAAPTEAPNLSATPAAASAGAPSPSTDAEERLRKLKELFDKGLITKDEYDQRRAAIVSSL
jgi:hypothetical protein